MEVVHKCGYKLLPDPPYSPNLASSNFHLFHGLKKYLWGQTFDDDLTTAVDSYLGDQDFGFYQMVSMTGKLDGTCVWSWKGIMLKNTAF